MEPPLVLDRLPTAQELFDAARAELMRDGLSVTEEEIYARLQRLMRTVEARLEQMRRDQAARVRRDEQILLYSVLRG